jgi:hypothetical protein
MEHVEVREEAAAKLETVEEMPGFEQRSVERFPVETDEPPGMRQLRADNLQQLPFVAGPQQDELARGESPLGVERAAARQKCVCAGAAAQAGRLQIEEDERWMRRIAAHHKGRRR